MSWAFRPPRSAAASPSWKASRIRLFDRANRKIALNSTGQLFLDYVRGGLAEIDHGVAALQRTEVVSLVTDTPEVWDAILGDYMFAFPNVRIANRS